MKLKKMAALLALVAVLISCVPNAVAMIPNEVEHTFQLQRAYPADVPQVYAEPTDRTKLSLSLTRIGEGEAVAHLEFEWNDQVFQVEAPGVLEAVQAGDVSGYVGVFEQRLFVNDTKSNIIVDLTYVSPDDIYAIATFGFLTDGDMEILYFGDKTENVRSVASAYAKLVMEEQSVNQDNHTIQKFESATREVEADPVCRGYKNFVAVSNGTPYALGQFSIFHARQLGNQHSAPVYAKITTNSTQLGQYLKKQYNYTLQSSGFDEVSVSIGSDSDPKLALSTDQYSPDAGSKSIQIPLPVIVPSVGLISVEKIPFTYERTTVSFEALSSAMADTRISWKMTKMSGWPSGALDGDVSTKTGLPVYTYVRYDGNITGNKTASMYSYANARYKYVEGVDASVATVRHLSLGQVPLFSEFTIVP